MGKATNFKFCTHIHRIDQNKSPLIILGTVAVGVLRDSRNFSGHTYDTSIWGTSRGHLCDSSAFLSACRDDSPPPIACRRLLKLFIWQLYLYLSVWPYVTV